MTYPVIAIDGTAASGKGTLAKKLAAALNFAYLDTGKLYRYVGMSVLQQGGDPANEDAAVAMAQALQGSLDPQALQDPALQTDEAGQAASKVAALPAVRSALLEYQRTFAQAPPHGFEGAVLDGRDIGTIVCPDACLKLYIDAKTLIRAERRHKELQSKGFSVKYDAVLADMQERDARDAGRETAPMKPADDAILLDTSDMGIDEVLDKALALAREKLAR